MLQSPPRRRQPKLQRWPLWCITLPGNCMTASTITAMNSYIITITHKTKSSNADMINNDEGMRTVYFQCCQTSLRKGVMNTSC